MKGFNLIFCRVMMTLALSNYCINYRTESLIPEFIKTREYTDSAPILNIKTKHTNNRYIIFFQLFNILFSMRNRSYRCTLNTF